MSQTQSSQNLLQNLLRDVRNLQDDLKYLASAADDNAQVFSDSLRLVECQMAIFQRMFFDFVMGRLVRQEDGTPDVDFYRTELGWCMVMADFVTWCKTLVPEVVAEPSPEDGAVIFGGNLWQSTLKDAGALSAQGRSK